MIGSSGTWQGISGYGGPYGYQEDETGIRLLGNRFYDPGAGRFLTRDPIQDGRNWYSYVENNPLTRADPSGLAKLILFWYEVVAEGYHTGIILIDNAKGAKEPFWSFAGGPERYGFMPEGKLFNNGKLISKSGPWQQGTQDYGTWDGGGIVLVDDDKPIGPWIYLLKRIIKQMQLTTTAEYSILPAPWGNTGNSNSWASELIDRAGLGDTYDHAILKRPELQAPWVPGWGKDVWK